MMYATHATDKSMGARIVGVAEPRANYRDLLLRQHPDARANVATDWRELADRPRCADAAVIATQDALHVEPAVAFAEKGYHILLEKPMARTPEDCRRIVDAARANGVMLAVCHVLRYTPYTRTLKAIVTSGRLGDLVNIQHLEPVGYWHQGHSFVRGNWRREDESTSMLLAKCCHDIDWLRHIMGVRCLAVSSFGTLKHFRREEQPAGAADRCLDCGIEPTCPYSAKKLYLGRLARGETDWPLDVLAPVVTEASILQALREGPYGRCVYACDNDVVDNQVVNLLYEGRRTASLTMVAFTETSHRRTRLFGTRGELEGNGTSIRVHDFLTDTWTDLPIASGDATAAGGHGGGDAGLTRAFLQAVATDDPSAILSGPDETLETHLTTFAAEQARREMRVVQLDSH